jgi:adenylate kinase
LIILIGRAGTGKSTQGQRIAKDLSCEWVSVGNVLRAHMSGDYVEQMLAGKILNDDQVLPLLDAEVKKIGADKNEFILDGSPRTMHQAKWWVNKIKKGEVRPTAVIHLDASEEVSMKRLLARGRPDDYEEAIKERFSEYQRVIIPILEYLEAQGLPLFHVNADRAPEEIEKEIEDIVYTVFLSTNLLRMVMWLSLILLWGIKIWL